MSRELDLGNHTAGPFGGKQAGGVLSANMVFSVRFTGFQARQAQRFGMSVYVALVTLEPPGETGARK